MNKEMIVVDGECVEEAKMSMSVPFMRNILKTIRHIFSIAITTSRDICFANVLFPLLSPE